MDLGLEGRIAIVTGGSQGIGRAIADVLVEEGAVVAICARRRHADVVVFFKLEEPFLELAQQPGGKRIPPLGVVERQDSHAVPQFVANKLSAHPDLLAVAQAVVPSLANPRCRRDPAG